MQALAEQPNPAAAQTTRAPQGRWEGALLRRACHVTTCATAFVLEANCATRSKLTAPPWSAASAPRDPGRRACWKSSSPLTRSAVCGGARAGKGAASFGVSHGLSED